MTLVALIRGINVGGHHKIKMDVLRALCEDLGFRNVRTYLQSGNVVFEASKKDISTAGKRIGLAIESRCGFCPEVLIRTAEEIGAIAQTNPFVGRAEVLPNKLGVLFLGAAPTVAIQAPAPEESVVIGREAYIYFANGMGNAKFSLVAVEKSCGPQWTVRNWNTVEALAKMCVC